MFQKLNRLIVTFIRCRIEININKWLSDECRLINFVVYFGDDTIVPTGDGHRCFVALHFANVVKLLDFVTNFNEPKINTEG